MIIKSVRIPTGDGRKFAKYLTNPGENEDIEVLLGSPGIAVANEFVSSIYSRMYGTRHVIVSPSKHLRLNQLIDVVKMYCDEFDVSEASRRRIVIARHEKKRSDYISEEDRDENTKYSEPENDIHYHIGIPEVDEKSGKVMDHEFDYIRNEKIARICEIKFGHPPVIGRFNKEVLSEIEGRYFFVDNKKFKPNLHALYEQQTEDK
jgi:hypothetical protein